MRATFFALLLANLLYMGWAHWIDVPAPPAASSIAGLPHLTLARELTPDQRAALARRMSLERAPQCVSVGPFDDPAVAAKAAALLKAKSFSPQQRATESQAIRRVWVYLNGFGTDAAVTSALHKLERRGIDDAEAMPPETGGRRISLGLFADRARADARAKVVRTMGFKPAFMERMLPGTVYWLDLTLPNGSAPVPLKDVSDLGPGGASTPVSVQACPTSATPATAPAPATTPASQESASAPSPASAIVLPKCKPDGGGPVPCILVKEAKQPSVF